MDLESLLSTLENDSHRKITRTSKQRIQEAVSLLDIYTPSLKQSFRLTKVQAALQRRHKKGLKGYQTLTQKIQDTTLLNTQPLHAYKTLTESRRHYTNRFSEIEQHLPQMNYTDAVYCLDELQTNTYLKRKATTNTNFAHKKGALEHKLQTYITQQEKTLHKNHTKQRFWTKTKNAAKAAIHLGYGLALGYAAASF